MLYVYISIGFYLIALYLFYIHALISTCLKPNELICYVQVFQVIGIYGTSSSQVLDLSVSEFCFYFQTHVFVME